MAAIVVASLLCVIGALFLVAVNRQVLANREEAAREFVEEFKDFINFKTPSFKDALALPSTVILTESRIDNSAFSKRIEITDWKGWRSEWSEASQQILQKLFHREPPANEPSLGTP